MASSRLFLADSSSVKSCLDLTLFSLISTSFSPSFVFMCCRSNSTSLHLFSHIDRSVSTVCSLLTSFFMLSNSRRRRSRSSRVLASSDAILMLSRSSEFARSVAFRNIVCEESLLRFFSSSSRVSVTICVSKAAFAWAARVAASVIESNLSVAI